MKLLAIYNVWSDAAELLAGSMRQIRPVVDGIMAVAQKQSNYGEVNPLGLELCQELQSQGVVDAIKVFVPTVGKGGGANETLKRQYGLEYGKENGYTHFLFVDCDDYYDTEAFRQARQTVAEQQLAGTVVRLWTYFGKPTLRLQKQEDYFAPFIHQLTPLTVAGYQPYPFRCDPTKCVSATQVVILEGITQHHYSYVRQDMEIKLRNSSVIKGFHGLHQSLRHDLALAKPGHYVSYYRDTLVEVPNYFGIEL